MTDIMQHWKENRFIVAPSELVDDTILIILTDIKFWAQHVDELIEWCRRTPGVETQGMTVSIRDSATLSLFLLRWS